MVVIKVSSAGRVVIPKPIRDAIGIRQGDQLEVAVDGDRVVLTRATDPATGRDWRRWQGFLKGTTALQDHLAEHRAEVERDEPLRPNPAPTGGADDPDQR